MAAKAAGVPFLGYTLSMKFSFYNDYAEGAHPKVLKALEAANPDQETGYGEDRFSLTAQNLIRTHLQQPTASIHFVSGGTQANIIALASMLRSFESVIAATSAHINMHEAGAIEATGHKINTIPNSLGKVTPQDIQRVCQEHADEHMVKPRVVFISQPTELGNVYIKQELAALSKICQQLNLFLYVDGARIGSAVVSSEADTSLADIASLVDALYLGGTKNGALFGEALVIIHPELQVDFRRHIKQRGGLLAKGRVLGAQFQELFTSDLFFELARQANTQAQRLAQGIKSLGYDFLVPPQTNQIFPIFPNQAIQVLQADYGFYLWSRLDQEKTSVRLVTSWATPTPAADQFLGDLKDCARLGQV